MSVSLSSVRDRRLGQSLTLCGQLAVIVGAFAAVVNLQAPQLAKLKHQNQNLSKAALQQQETTAKLQLSLVKALPSFGYKNLVADWYFMGFLQYFGDTDVRQQAGYGAAMDYFEIVLDRDPRFLYAYYYLSTTGALYAGEPERSVAMMAQGLKSFTPRIPDRGFYIWRQKSVDELLFLGKVADARRSMQTAADWARQYPDPQSQTAAKISQQTVKFLASNPHSKQARFAAWNMVLSNAIDESVAKRAIAEIRALGGNVSVSPSGELKVVGPIGD